LFSCFLVWASQNRPKDSNSGLHMHFLWESEKFWTKSALTLWKRSSESE
jgi:hypothetical protein